MEKKYIFQGLLGLLVWAFLTAKPKKLPSVVVGDLHPVGFDYVSTYFKDSEYFGKNVLPIDFYSNWLHLAFNLDKIRAAFGSPILVVQGFTISDEIFAECRAVIIYPKNNDVDKLKEVLNALQFDLPEILFEFLPDKKTFRIVLV